MKQPRRTIMQAQLYEISTISRSGVIQFNRISADDDQEAVGYLDEWLVTKKVMGIPYRDLGAVFKVFAYPSMRLVKIRVPHQPTTT